MINLAETQTMYDIISDFIQIYNKRVFVDIASNGCGSGCVYCFTKNPEKQQALLEIPVIDEICNTVLNLPNCNDCIISLCPNTEPMKSKESRKLILRIINRLIDAVKFVQIATKEEIPESFLNELSNMSKRTGQIRISVSLPYLNFANILEPGAAPVYDRLKNFDNIKKYDQLLSVLYLRPFNKQMIVDKQLYIDLIKRYQPDNICLGAEFVPKVAENQQCTYMYNNDLKSSIFEKPEIDEIFDFADFVRKNTGSKVFFSSVCNIANCSDYGCVLKLGNHDMRYCKDCELPLSER